MFVSNSSWAAPPVGRGRLAPPGAANTAKLKANGANNNNHRGRTARTRMTSPLAALAARPVAARRPPPQGPRHASDVVRERLPNRSLSQRLAFVTRPVNKDAGCASHNAGRGRTALNPDAWFHCRVAG